MIFGHKDQILYLDRILKKNVASGAFLFIGPSKIGKRKIAEDFLKAANCSTHSVSDAFLCNQCMGQDFLNPDFLSIANVSAISIDAIRDLNSFFSTKSLLGSKKTAIIDFSYGTSFDAASAFLKTLEEPKAKSLTILITNSKRSLLPTIVSRCKTIRFGKVSKEEIMPLVSSLNVSSAFRQKILDFYRGLPGEIFEWQNTPEKLLKIERNIRDFLEVSQSDFPKISSFVENLARKENNEKDLKETILNWLYYLEQNFNPKFLPALMLLEDFERKITEKRVDPILLLENFFLSFSQDI